MSHFIKAEIVGTNIDPDEYHKQEFERGDPRFVMSRSELVDFAQCPDKWVHGGEKKDEEEDEEETESTAHGSLVDCLVTDRDRFDQRYAVCPQNYTTDKGEEKPWNRGAKACKEWEAEQEGKTTIKFDKMENANKAHRRLLDDRIISEFIRCSANQVMATAVWKDPSTGLEIPVKTMLDFVPDKDHPDFGRTLGDLKTCRTAKHKGFRRQTFDEGYHIQGAFYSDVYVAATKEDRCSWLLVLSENKAPFQPGRRYIDSDMIHQGRGSYIGALMLYAMCLKTKVWPGYDDVDGQIIKGWSTISLEPWMVSQS